MTTNSLPPTARLAFDCVVLSVLDRKLHIALARRHATNEIGLADPFPGGYSLPGGYVRDDESIAQTIKRRLAPEIGLTLNPVHFGVFDDPKRDPRHRVVSIAYLALIPSDQAGRLRWSHAYDNGQWHAVEQMPKRNWAFDHQEIAKQALLELKRRAKHEPIGFDLLPEQFSMPELHDLQEQLRQEKIDLRNFRRTILLTGLLEEVGSRPSTRGYPTKLYRAQPTARKRLWELGF